MLWPQGDGSLYGSVHTHASAAGTRATARWAAIPTQSPPRLLFALCLGTTTMALYTDVHLSSWCTYRRRASSPPPLLQRTPPERLHLAVSCYLCLARLAHRGPRGSWTGEITAERRTLIVRSRIDHRSLRLKTRCRNTERTSYIRYGSEARRRARGQWSRVVAAAAAAAEAAARYLIPTRRYTNLARSDFGAVHWTSGYTTIRWII